jgi:hypothetical protein
MWCHYGLWPHATKNGADPVMFLSLIFTGWWFGTWILWLSIYYVNNNPNWRTHIFQRGWNHQPDLVQQSFSRFSTWKVFCLLSPSIFTESVGMAKNIFTFFPLKCTFCQTYLWAATSHIQLIPWKLATQDGQLMIMEPCPVYLAPSVASMAQEARVQYSIRALKFLHVFFR